MTLRLILGDQLNYCHSWYNSPQEDVIYFMAEMRQETDYVDHHIQKVVSFFKSMRNFHQYLTAKQCNVIYYPIDDERNTQDLLQNLSLIIQQNPVTTFEYQMPDEYRLDQQLKDFCRGLEIDYKVYDTEHFLTERLELTDFFEGKKKMVMEYFYRMMRRKYDLLIEPSGDPVGGKWNYDQSNRKKWKEETDVPKTYTSNIPVNNILNQVDKAGIKTIGLIPNDKIEWPTSRKESLDVLQYFCENLLVHFGDYQDAMHTEQRYLYHSKLSFGLNTKMLSPLEVVQKVINYWEENQAMIDLSQVEGFVRQIIGWREYMRGIYWQQMPDYATKNFLNNTNPLPGFFWSGNTKMNCLHHAITQSLENAYAHHIQRLMITGNFALLALVHPDEVDEWYLGIYIDAIEWVEITNTRGMSQFADGGIVATKPYVSSGSYINKMSNYCKDCAYNVKNKVGEDACPFNALYWNFLDEKRPYFEKNNRMSMMLRLLDKMDPTHLKALKQRAQGIIKNPDEY